MRIDVVGFYVVVYGDLCILINRRAYNVFI